MLDCQASTVWSGRIKKHGGCLSSWKCFPYIRMFSVTLLYAMKTELNITLLVVQTILAATSHLCQGSNNKHKAMLYFGTQDSAHVPLWSLGRLSKLTAPTPLQKLDSLLLLSSPFSLVLLLHSSCSRKLVE